MATFYRLLGFLKPYKPGLAISWGLASLAMAMTRRVALPDRTGGAGDPERRRAVHGHPAAARAHDRHTLLVLALVILGVVLAAGASCTGVASSPGRVSLAVEYDLRERIYRQLQRLELGFFDHQQTGQLMSRATVDLAAVRFFLGYGLVFILQSILTIALAGAVMLAIIPGLGLLALVPVPFVVADLLPLWPPRTPGDPGDPAAHRRADRAAAAILSNRAPLLPSD